MLLQIMKWLFGILTYVALSFLFYYMKQSIDILDSNHSIFLKQKQLEENHNKEFIAVLMFGLFAVITVVLGLI